MYSINLEEQTNVSQIFSAKMKETHQTHFCQCFKKQTRKSSLVKMSDFLWRKKRSQQEHVQTKNHDDFLKRSKLKPFFSPKTYKTSVWHDAKKTTLQSLFFRFFSSTWKGGNGERKLTLSLFLLCRLATWTCTLNQPSDIGFYEATLTEVRSPVVGAGWLPGVSPATSARRRPTCFLVPRVSPARRRFKSSDRGRWKGNGFGANKVARNDQMMKIRIFSDRWGHDFNHCWLPLKS